MACRCGWRASLSLALIVGGLGCLADSLHGAEVPKADDWIRAQAATLPTLVTGAETGSPKFTVVRMNAPALTREEERYGAVRLLCPVNRRTDLVWVFSDVTNIDEYRLIPLKPGKPITSGVRQIYRPTASLEIDDDSARGHPASLLPRPWDLFELHLLGVPAALLVPGEEYVIWFRFSDRRPTDILLAASFIEPLGKLEPAALAPVLALPPQAADP